MRRIIWLATFALLSSLLSFTVGAAPSLYNDPHGQWSLVLPDSYTIIDQQYYIGTKGHPGFYGVVFFQLADRTIVSVRYYECCPPDSVNLPQFAQQDFDTERQNHPDATIGTDGIRPTMLAGQPAVRFDLTETNNGTFIHGREIVTHSGGLVYALGFLTTKMTLGEIAEQIITITDSFRFVTRSIEQGVYSDPLGRFTLTVPAGYDLLPSPIDAVQDNQLSLATFSNQPTADRDDFTGMIVQTYPDAMNFDERFDVYAHAGLDAIAKKGGEIGASGVRAITIDGHPAGTLDYYQLSGAGIRVHIYQIFTVLSGTQYFIAFNFAGDDQRNAENTVDTLVSSFHFQAG